MSGLQERLRSIPAAVLASLQRGIEKESLRIDPDGTLATSPHPRQLGAALTHPHITTDFSEAQPELITGVHATAEACLAELTELHRFVYRHIGDEALWCASMPCNLPDEDAIPIAQFGESNIGRAKTLYRTGLAHRYGRRMQLISGLHYNFSLPEHSWPVADFADSNQAYFALIRNFRRHAWLLLYLFGASPTACASFVRGRTHELQTLSPGSLYLPYATSLRMGRLGYLSAAQDALAVSYNDLHSYAASLEDALTKPYPPYEAIGVRDGAQYKQLATTLLQIENEFYSTIRPKRVGLPGERPLRALRERGVQYIEVRAMDLDPFSRIGITAGTVRFLDIFLLHCLLSDSPPDTAEEIGIIGRNKQRVAASGREPGLELERPEGSMELHAWCAQLLTECKPIAAALDSARGSSDYRDALSTIIETASNPQKLPSARMLTVIREHHGGSYFRFTLEQSLRYREDLLRDPLPAQAESRLRRISDESLEAQRKLEAKDQPPFETYRQQYIARDSLSARKSH